MEIEFLFNKFEELSKRKFYEWINSEGDSYLKEFYPDLVDEKHRYFLSLLLKNRKTKINDCQTCGDKTIGVTREEDSRGILVRVEKTFCSISCRMKSDSYKKNMEDSIMKKYGVKHSSQIKEVKDKKKKTNLKRHGVENPSSLKWFRDKVDKTNLERYGVKNVSQSSVVKETIKANNLEKYGVSHTSKLKSNRDKAEATTLKRFGVRNAFASDEIKAKVKDSVMKRHGVSHISKIESVKEKKRNNLRIKSVERIMKMIENKYELIEEFKTNKKSTNYNYDDKQTNKTYYVQYLIKCSKCHNTFRDDLELMPRCPVCCKSNVSMAELNIKEFIENLGFKTEKIRIENKEIDIYIPSLKIGFEYNGTYWHSLRDNSKRSKFYHQAKTDLCLKNGIKLYHIWEYNDLDKIKSKIKTILGLNKRIFARKCEIRIIDQETSKDFFDLHHLHNYVPGKVKLGLFHENRLVSSIIMKKHDDHYEISRFVSKSGLTVVGGFSKLLSHFTKIYNPNKIMTYADRDWTPDPSSSGYSKSNFNYLGDSGPILNYHLNNNIVVDRRRFQKHKLEKMFPDSYDDNLTEQQILSQNNIYPIYNSGNHKFELLSITKLLRR